MAAETSAAGEEPALDEMARSSTGDSKDGSARSKAVPPHGDWNAPGSVSGGSTEMPEAADAGEGRDADYSGPEMAEAAMPTLAALAAIIAERDKEIAVLRDQAMRAHAEMENIRKRTERERHDSLRYANTGFARDMVTVADNFQRAIDAVPVEARERAGPLASLVEGVAMIEREFLKALARHGVTPQEPLEKPFDPNHHQAVMEVPDPSVPTGTVVQVLQAGYAIADRVLRPAMVAVSRGGPKAARTTPADSSEAAPDDAGEEAN